MPLPSTNKLDITIPAPNRRMILHAVANRESTNTRLLSIESVKAKAIGVQLEDETSRRRG